MLWCAHDLGLNRPVVEQTALAALDVTVDEELSKRIDEIVPPGGVTGPYLDDSFADFRPQRYRW